MSFSSLAANVDGSRKMPSRRCSGLIDRSLSSVAISAAKARILIDILSRGKSTEVEGASLALGSELTRLRISSPCSASLVCAFAQQSFSSTMRAKDVQDKYSQHQAGSLAIARKISPFATPLCSAQTPIASAIDPAIASACFCIFSSDSASIITLQSASVPE